MCDNCAEIRAGIQAELLGLLQNDPENRIVRKIDEELAHSVTEITKKRIAPAVETGKVEMPPEEDIREAVRACLVAAALALGAASIAAHTPGYTDEGQLDKSIILGMWAGIVMNAESELELQAIAESVAAALGLGNN